MGTEPQKKHMNVRIDERVIELSKHAAAIQGMELRDYVQETMREAATKVVEPVVKRTRKRH